jgi:hypothetical protein
MNEYDVLSTNVNWQRGSIPEFKHKQILMFLIFNIDFNNIFTACHTSRRINCTRRKTREFPE